VLKDILLVFASMLLFNDPVSLLQAFGYGIALAGLMYYKLGPDVAKDLVGQGSLKWADLGARYPAGRKMLIFAVFALVGFMLLTGLGPRIAPESTQALYDGVATHIHKSNS
jgi:hypothetical protein